MAEQTDLFSEKTVVELDAISQPWKQTKPWRDPTDEEIEMVLFNKIWSVIKHWDIAVPGAYQGYCSATGNHAVAILNALTEEKSELDFEQWR
jgi:hypothetical protein